MRRCLILFVVSGSKAAYPGHVPLSGFEQGFLAVGSAIASLVNPYRHGLSSAFLWLSPTLILLPRHGRYSR